LSHTSYYTLFPGTSYDFALGGSGNCANENGLGIAVDIDSKIKILSFWIRTINQPSI